ncbi:MAG: SusC/RagA family TonB-linked outer membrane protein [Chryseobacterium sp.]|nr:MAG: SusC/RagA family TonB-linked outer membrane protein [Chryseobacterium sp.]
MRQDKSNPHAKKWDILIVCITLIIVFFSAISCFAQTARVFAVKGKVNFADIKVKATVASRYNERVQTDENGNFSINISRLPDTLTITAMGYKTAYFTLKSGREEIIVAMSSESLDLGQVEISTGYQRLKPNETNGTVAVINKEQLNARGGSNILDRLLGQSSGLLQNVGKSANNVMNKTGLSVRGVGTINGPLDPLIVLDGFIYEGSIDNINPNDIEQVSILKDAAAASIWGARAGNGVIVLTSKKSAFNQKISVDFSASDMIQSLPDLFARPQMNSSDYIEIERLKFDKGFYNSRITSTPYLALSPAVELLLKKRNGTLTSAQTEAALDLLKSQDTRQNALKAFYTHAQTRQYSLGIKGGSELYSFLLSGSYQDILGETYNTSNKININFQQEIRLSGKLKLSTKTYYTNNSSTSGRPSYASLNVANQALPYLSFFDVNGNPSPLATAYRAAFTDTLANGKLLDWKYYPAEDYLHMQTQNTSTEIFANAALSYKILDFMDASLSYQYQNQHAEGSTYGDEGSYSARGTVNTFSQYNRTTNVVTYVVPRGGIDFWNTGDIKSYTFRGQLNMDKTFGDHHLNVMAGAEMRQVSNIGSGDVRYGYSQDPLLSSPVDEVGFYKNPMTGSSQQIGSSMSLSSTKYRFISNYFNLAYTWKRKYILSASARSDGSNIFGASTNDKWKPLWSAGLGWNLSNESFYKISWLPRLKLKGTFGYSGNVDLTKTALSVGTIGTNSVTGLPYTRINAINNPGLRWEQLSQASLSVDFASIGNRISGSVAFFKKRGKDLYGPSLYDYTAWGGNSTITRNVADMTGKGFELDLHSLNIVHGAFKWLTDTYFNYNDSRTLSYYSESNNGLYNLIGSGGTITPIVGKPLYALAVYKYAGLDKAGNPMGYLNGIPSIDYRAMATEAIATGDNLVYMGSASPVYYGSFINTFQYKAFSLSVNFSYKLGYYALKSSFSSYDMIQNGKGYGDYDLRWQKPGDELITTVPAFTYPANGDRDGFYGTSQANAIKADNIRLDYISLKYRLDFNKSRQFFKSLEANIGVQGLGVIWSANKFDLDPDYLNTYPPTRAILFGFKTGF